MKATNAASLGFGLLGTYVIGHAVEGQPPEFHDWRFLVVGLRW